MQSHCYKDKIPMNSTKLCNNISDYLLLQSNLVISNKMGKLRDIRVIDISREKLLKYKWLGLTNNLDISIVFKISVLEIPKFNCIINTLNT